MLGQILAIARNTFVESLRQPIFFVLVMAAGAMQVVNTLLSAYSMDYSEQLEVTADNKLLLDMGLATVLVCATLLAAFVATSVVSREIENKTALTVISKPVGRPLFVIGKYLGIAGAITVAAVIMLIFFLFAIRHSVMSTARDTVDGPVLLFASTAVLIALALGIWGNFFYGWVFSSTVIGSLLPLVVIGYLITMMVSKEWEFQPISTDFKPQVTLAAVCVLLCLLVLTSIAVACSTRLGQVMTIVFCAGALMLGLLSNHLLGRHAFDNEQISVIESVEPDRIDTADMRKAGNFITVTLKTPPSHDLKVGDELYFGPNPNGVGLAVPAQQAFTGDATKGSDVENPRQGPALVIRAIEPKLKFVLVNVNNLAIERLPEKGDYIFLHQTGIHPLPRVAWGIIPNFQYYWLVDAITQGHTVPVRYFGMLAAYGFAQIIAFLSIGVLLFQRRDVG